jgi:hypothetical protein
VAEVLALAAVVLALAVWLPPRIRPAPQARSAPRQAAPEAQVCAAKEEAPAERIANRPPERETFGTAVEFVPNPALAARVAEAEGKLTFLLHVSGNFEEARFT